VAAPASSPPPLFSLSVFLFASFCSFFFLHFYRCRVSSTRIYELRTFRQDSHTGCVTEFSIFCRIEIAKTNRKNRTDYLYLTRFINPRVRIYVVLLLFVYLRSRPRRLSSDRLNCFVFATCSLDTYNPRRFIIGTVIK